MSERFSRGWKCVPDIGHRPWTSIQADVVRGRTSTSWPCVQADLRNAAATWADQEIVVCANGLDAIASSSTPDDLAGFDRELITAFSL